MNDVLARLDELTAERRDAFLALLAQRGREFNVFPLSFAQGRLWLLAQLHPESPAYNGPFAFHLKGELDVEALERALQRLVDRHEMLRTVFFELDGEPRQIVLPDMLLRLDRAEAAGGAADERQAWAATYVGRESRRPFDLRRGPLIRAGVVRTGERGWLLLLVLHHIIADGWSMAVLFRELERCYAAERAGLTSAMPPQPVQYPDFVLWQRESMRDGVEERLLSYWRHQLDGAPALLELPTDHPRAPVLTSEGGQETFTWPLRTTEELEAFCREQGVTPFMAMLAAWALLMHRYSGASDIVVGTPFANRNREDVEGIVGLFVNTVLIRVHISGGASFRTLVQQVRETVLAAQSHQEMPFDRLVDALQPDRDLSHSPLCQVMFVMQESRLEVLRLAGLEVSPLPAHSGGSRLDLTLAFIPTSSGLKGTFEYDSRLFEPVTVRRMAGHLHVLLTAAIADPEREVGTLSLLPEGERTYILDTLNDTSRPPGAPARADLLFEEVVDRTPDAPAAVFEGRVLTYRELDERANRLAHHLRSLGVAEGALVGLSIERSLDLLIGVLGVMKAGCAYVPLDPAYPRERLALMIEDARVRVVVTQAALVARLPAGEARVVQLDADSPAISRQDATRPSRLAGPEARAYVIYTSGSTGRPKGVVLTHRGLSNVAAAQREAFQLGPDDRVLQFASLSFDASIFEVVLAVGAGASVCLAAPSALQPGPELAGTIRTCGVTAAVLPPTALTMMAADEVPSLRTLIVAGEACPGELVAAWAPGRAFFNAYGPTETTIWATVARCDTGGGRPPIGTPIRNTRAYVLDRRMQPVPTCVQGDLYLAGAGLAEGYLGQPALTAERFLPDALGGRAGGRLYDTGDVARRRSDGALEFGGRRDSQLKVRGYRVEPGEVEAHLDSHAAVRRSVVVARGDVGDDRSLVAYVVPRARAAVSVETLKRALQTSLPAYMIPSTFVFLDGLPLTPSGKVDHRALPTPDSARPLLEVRYAAPESALERRIARVWGDLLRLEKVGVHDNFFDLGGNSLLLSRVRSRLQSGLQLHIPALALFQHPTVHTLAGYLHASGPDSGGSTDDEAGRLDQRRQALAELARRRARPSERRG